MATNKSPVPFARPSKESFLEKPLPNNVEAERSVLGAILLDATIPNAALKTAFELLNSEDFFDDSHRRIWRAMLVLADSKRPIDLVTLTDQLRVAGNLEQAGGEAYVAQLVDGVPRVSNVAHYADIVRKNSQLRQLIHVTHDIQQAALEGTDKAEDLLTRFDQASKQIGNGYKSQLVAVDLRDFLRMPLPALEWVVDPLLTLRGRGMIYSPRGGGKTYVTMQMAYSVATGTQFFVWGVPQRRRVVYVDGEMHAAMLQDRQVEIARINGGVDPPTPDAGYLRLITRDLQKDVRPKINSKYGRDQIEAHLESGTLLILDNLSALSPSSDEKETEDWAEIEDWLSNLSWHGISTVFVNHAGKSGDQRGTSKREDLVDFVLKLRVPSAYTADEGLRAELHLTKLRGRKPTLAEGRPFELRLGTNEHGEPAWFTRQLRELLLERARAMLMDGMRPQDVSAETGLDRWAVARLVRKMKLGATGESEQA